MLRFSFARWALASVFLFGCSELASDQGAGVCDAGACETLDGSRLAPCMQDPYGTPIALRAIVPLAFIAPDVPDAPSASSGWVCDGDPGHASAWTSSNLYRRTRSTGCGFVAWRDRRGLFAQWQVRYDAATGARVWAWQRDELPFALPGIACESSEFLSGPWPSAACEDAVDRACRPAGTRVACTPESIGHPYEPAMRVPVELVRAGRALLADQESEWTCDVDPADVVDNPPGSGPYPMTRTAGCGRIVYASAPGWWPRMAIYDSAVGPGLRVGARVSDDVVQPLAPDLPSECAAATFVGGIYPPPSCDDEVVHYCRPAP